MRYLRSEPGSHRAVATGRRSWSSRCRIGQPKPPPAARPIKGILNKTHPKVISPGWSLPESSHFSALEHLDLKDDSKHSSLAILRRLWFPTEVLACGIVKAYFVKLQFALALTRIQESVRLCLSTFCSCLKQHPGYQHLSETTASMCPTKSTPSAV